MEQLVHENTRDNHTLDLIFCTNPARVTSVSVIPGISDHEAVFFVLIQNPPGTKTPVTVSICITEEILIE